MNLTVVGHICLDKNTSENSSYESIGGPAFFISKISEYFPNVTTSIISPHGEDLTLYQNSLIIYPVIPTSKKTLIYFNITKNGRRTQKALHREYSVPPPLTKEIEIILENTDILFIAPLVPNLSASYIHNVKKHIRKDTLTVLLPQGYFRDFDALDTVMPREFSEAHEILPHADLVIVSEQDSDNMMNLAEEWSKKNNIISIVTLGGKGAVAFQGNDKILMPTDEVPEDTIVDSVGAGDIFSMAFALRYAREKNIEAAGAFGNKIARQSLFYTTENMKITI